MKVLFCGDISAGYEVRELWKRKAPELLGDTLGMLRDSDCTVVNLECAISDRDTPIRKFGPNLSLPPAAARVLAEAGVTHCCLSNNHSYDFGAGGLQDTQRALEAVNIRWAGAGKNLQEAGKDLVFRKEGKTLRVLPVCEHEYSYALEDRPGARPFELYETMEQIAEARRQADFVAVLYHGGKEFCRYPSPRLRTLCRQMVKSGADLVLCQHSHCIGCLEQMETGQILYGQGNFFFPEEEDEGEIWNQGLAVELELGEKTGIRLIPVILEKERLRLAREPEKREILKELEMRSRSLEDGSWRQGWHSFCLQNQQQYQQVLENFHLGGEEDRELFAHYLDCEAHRDVWEELYPTWHRTGAGQEL